MAKEKAEQLPAPKGPGHVTITLDRDAAKMAFELVSKAAAVGADSTILSRLYTAVEKATKVYRT